jgi:hypothetical protein
MKFIKIIFISFLFITMYSCAEFQINTQNEKKGKIYYSSTGFALIYEEKLFHDKVIKKKFNNTDFETMHSFLKKNTPVKIVNPINSKFIETKISFTGDYPKLFNVVINKKIESFLDLDPNNPYIEIIELKKNKLFIAKDGEIFDEEKNVAGKVPVTEVKMDDITLYKKKLKKKIKEKKNFIIGISDFYYQESADTLSIDLKKKTNLKNISVKKINNNKYRLLVGPFKNFNALKTTYISLNNLGFEQLNIYNE